MAVASAPTDVREHVLAVAQPILLSKGFAAVGLNEVLTAAGVPKGSFYYYFSSKEDFGEAVLDTYFEEYLTRVDALLSGPGPAADRLMAYFQDWLDSQTGPDAQSRCLAVKLGAEVSDLSERMRSALERGTRSVTERLARCVEAGRADGSLPDSLQADTTAAALYQSWLGASLLAKIQRDPAPLDTALIATRTLLALPPER